MARAARFVLELRVGPFAEADLRVARAQGREALSRPFEVTVDFELRVDQPLASGDLVGQEAQLALRHADGTERFVHGLCEAVELTTVRKGTRLYRLRLVPKLALLAHRRDARVFQGQTVPEVVQAVLGGPGVDFRDDLQGSYPVREYCVQYRETDLAFVSRLLAEEGILWFFEQSDGAHTMVLADSPTSFQDIPGDPGLPFRPPQGGGDADSEHLRTLEWSGRVRPLKVTLRDFDQERPDLDLTEKATGSGPNPIEVYEYRLRYASSGELKRLATRRLEQARVASTLLSGEAESLRLTPGTCFESTEHPDATLNRRIQVVSLDFEAARSEDRSLGVEASHTFRCRWLGQPAGT
jgi:type VI secretion system secreted protein VgrG